MASACSQICTSEHCSTSRMCSEQVPDGGISTLHPGTPQKCEVFIWKRLGEGVRGEGGGRKGGREGKEQREVYQTGFVSLMVGGHNKYHWRFEAQKARCLKKSAFEDYLRSRPFHKSLGQFVLARVSATHSHLASSKKNTIMQAQQRSFVVRSSQDSLEP